MLTRRFTSSTPSLLTGVEKFEKFQLDEAADVSQFTDVITNRFPLLAHLDHLQHSVDVWKRVTKVIISPDGTPYHNLSEEHRVTGLLPHEHPPGTTVYDPDDLKRSTTDNPDVKKEGADKQRIVVEVSRVRAQLPHERREAVPPLGPSDEDVEEFVTLCLEFKKMKPKDIHAFLLSQINLAAATPPAGKQGWLVWRRDVENDAATLPDVAALSASIAGQGLTAATETTLSKIAEDFDENKSPLVDLDTKKFGAALQSPSEVADVPVVWKSIARLTSTGEPAVVNTPDEAQEIILGGYPTLCTYLLGRGIARRLAKDAQCKL